MCSVYLKVSRWLLSDLRAVCKEALVPKRLGGSQLCFSLVIKVLRLPPRCFRSPINSVIQITSATEAIYNTDLSLFVTDRAFNKISEVAVRLGIELSVGTYDDKRKMLSFRRDSILSKVALIPSEWTSSFLFCTVQSLNKTN